MCHRNALAAPPKPLYGKAVKFLKTARALGNTMMSLPVMQSKETKQCPVMLLERFWLIPNYGNSNLEKLLLEKFNLIPLFFVK